MEEQQRKALEELYITWNDVKYHVMQTKKNI